MVSQKDTAVSMTGCACQLLQHDDELTFHVSLTLNLFYHESRLQKQQSCVQVSPLAKT